jgi:hypothetical protein
MCIYCGTTNYRKIYENHYGPIPKDDIGWAYDIHHIDGDRKNNHPDNLIAVTVQEHYDIHYAQGDWMACWKIGVRIRKPMDELSELASKGQKIRVQNGTHHLLGGEIQGQTSRRRVKEGTHHLLGGQLQRQRVASGEHHFLGGEIARVANRERIANKTHNLLGGAVTRKQLETGTHASQIMKTCEHCGETVNAMQFGRFHGIKCPKRKIA